MRTNTGWRSAGFPMTSATALSGKSGDSNAKILNVPNGVGREVPLVAFNIRSLPIHSGHPLHLARETGLRRNRAECCVAEVGVRSSELRRIGRVVGFQAERQPDVLG